MYYGLGMTGLQGNRAVGGIYDPNETHQAAAHFRRAIELNPRFVPAYEGLAGVLPALETRSWLAALGFGALLGLVAYGTYDFTNLSTLRNWPLALSLVDVAWGVALTGITALGGYWAVRWLLPG